MFQKKKKILLIIAQKGKILKVYRQRKDRLPNQLLMINVCLKWKLFCSIANSMLFFIIVEIF